MQIIQGSGGEATRGFSVPANLDPAAARRSIVDALRAGEMTALEAGLAYYEVNPHLEPEAFIEAARQIDPACHYAVTAAYARQAASPAAEPLQKLQLADEAFNRAAKGPSPKDFGRSRQGQLAHASIRAAADGFAKVAERVPGARIPAAMAYAQAGAPDLAVKQLNIAKDIAQRTNNASFVLESVHMRMKVADWSKVNRDLEALRKSGELQQRLRQGEFEDLDPRGPDFLEYCADPYPYLAAVAQPEVELGRPDNVIDLSSRTRDRGPALDF